MNEQQRLQAEYARARNVVDALVLSVMREQGLAAQLQEQERQAQQQAPREDTGK